MSTIIGDIVNDGAGTDEVEVEVEKIIQKLADDTKWTNGDVTAQPSVDTKINTSRHIVDDRARLPVPHARPRVDTKARKKNRREEKATRDNDPGVVARKDLVMV